MHAQGSSVRHRNGLATPAASAAIPSTVDLHIFAAALASGSSRVPGRASDDVVETCAALGATVGYDGYSTSVIGNGGSPALRTELTAEPDSTGATMAACTTACAGFPFTVVLSHPDRPHARLPAGLESLLFRHGVNFARRDGVTVLRSDAHPEMMPVIVTGPGTGPWAAIFAIAARLRGKDLTVICDGDVHERKSMQAAVSIMRSFGACISTTTSGHEERHFIRAARFSGQEPG